MRPPSYYASIVKSNTNHGHSYSSSDYDSGPRTSSQQLRSSLSSPSSSSYVSRSHLPYVPNSTLVAHCFTGVGSSTRPYGSSGGTASSSSSSYHRNAAGGGTSYISSTSSLTSGYTSGSISSLSSRPPSTKRAYSSSSSSSNSYSSPTTPSSTTTTSSSASSSSSASLLRPSYLSPSSVSTASRYRPITASSYYKPIRLRERPLLTQISRQIASPTPPPAALSSAGNSRTATPTNQNHSNNSRSDYSRDQADARPASGEPTQPDDWSSDVGRNISRNKYLIKFREIDKSTATGRRSVDVEATIRLVDDSSRAPSSERQGAGLESVAAAATNESLSVVVDLAKSSTCTEDARKELPPLPASKIAGAEKKRDINNKSDEMRLVTNDDQLVRKVQTNKDKKNVKLRLRPVGAKRADKPEATTLTTTTVDKPAAGKEQTATPGEQQTATQAVAKVKRVAKVPKEDKENQRSDKEGARPTTKPASDGTKLETESKPPSAGKTTETAKVAVTKKRTKKEALAAKPADDESQQGEPTSGSGAELGKLGQKPAEASSQKAAAINLVDGPAAATRTKTSCAGDAPVTPKKAAPARIRFREYHYDDFNFLTVLGHGGWGFVILAELKEHDACFAVKCIKKITIVEDDDYDSIMIERKVLTLGNIHPFICKLFCTFETEVSMARTLLLAGRRRPRASARTVHPLTLAAHLPSSPPPPPPGLLVLRYGVLPGRRSDVSRPARGQV
jgi:hypothetical protein